MSRAHHAQRTSSPIGNPFRAILPKRSSYLSPKLFSLLAAFEQTLAEGLRKLKPNNSSDVLSLSWIRQAMELLSETHTNIKTLTTALNFPGSNWDEKWMDMYLDDSIKVLDICNGLTSELSRFDQRHLSLKYTLHILTSSEQLDRVHASLRDWTEKAHSIHSMNPKLEKCSSILEELASTVHPIEVKNSAKGKLLMRALYGVKIVTIFVCSVFAAALSGCSKPPMNLDVSGEFLWAEAFNDLQAHVNGEINRLFSCGKFGVLSEVEAVNARVEKLQDSSIDTESYLDLAESAECFATELDLLSRQLEEFFRLVLAGRNALLSSLTASDVQFKGKAGKFR